MTTIGQNNDGGFGPFAFHVLSVTGDLHTRNQVGATGHLETEVLRWFHTHCVAPKQLGFRTFQGSHFHNVGIGEFSQNTSLFAEQVGGSIPTILFVEFG